MMQMKTQKKRAELEVYPESSFIMGENETSILETRQPMQQESFDILDDAKASLSPQLYQIIEMTFSGYSNVEIAAAQGVTTQAIYDRKKKAVKHLRLYYEIDAPINKGHEPKIRSRTRSNATDTYKAETHSHTEAMSYLGLA